MRVGALLHDASHGDTTDVDSGERAPTSDRPWLTAIGSEVAAGRLSVAAAEAIRSGLGVPDAGVSAEELARAAARIAATAAGLDADELYRRARNLFRRLGVLRNPTAGERAEVASRIRREWQP